MGKIPKTPPIGESKKNEESMYLLTATAVPGKDVPEPQCSPSSQIYRWPKGKCPKQRTRGVRKPIDRPRNGRANNVYVDDIRPAPDGNHPEPDPNEEIPGSDTETSEDEGAEQPTDLRRTLDSNEELQSAEETEITTEGVQIPREEELQVNAALRTVNKAEEKWQRQWPSTLKETCLEAGKLVDLMVKELHPQVHVLDRYEELVTNIILHLDNFDLKNSPTLKAARKQNIARLEKAQ